jgi:serine/threonine protein kinase
VHIHGFYKQQRGPNAIALEAGESNLFLLLQRGGPLRGAELRTIAGDMLHALRQIHESGLVWTDCKLQNFICVRDRSTLRAKAIDFESCVENGESLADLSPVSSPPELARALLARENPPPSATSEGDVWALGLSLLALSTNVLPAPMRLGLSPAQVFEATLSMYDGAASGEDRVESYLRAVNNPMLRRLLSKMLALEPKQRLSASQALASPYFWSIF